jgi:AcrR family transcriptional regulator
MTEPPNPAAYGVDTQSRRQLLIKTASQLFAQKGIDAVSLNEINKAAGQRNTSAMHYHFGSKEGLVQAIIYEHYAAIDEQINELLDLWEARPATQRNARGLLGCLILPFARQLDSEEGINYLLIVRQVLIKSSDLLVLGHPDGEDIARLRIFAMFKDHMANLPAEVRAARLVVNSGTLFNALATYAQSQQRDNGFQLGSKELFTNNLLDIMEAQISAPPSTATLDCLPK